MESFLYESYIYFEIVFDENEFTKKKEREQDVRTAYKTLIISSNLIFIIDIFFNYDPIIIMYRYRIFNKLFWNIIE